MLVTTFSGNHIQVDPQSVECARGTRLESGKFGTVIYFKDGTQLLVSDKFDSILFKLEKSNQTHPAGEEAGEEG